MKRVFAALVSFIIVIATQQTYASEYGCTVLLCLANPISNGGPKGMAECISPINRLYDDLLHGRPFPSCDQSDGNDARSYAKPVFDYYDPCQPPLRVAPAGSYVVQGIRKSSQSGWPLTGNAFQLSGSPGISESTKGVSSRACVDNHVGRYAAHRSFNNIDYVDVYTTVQWMKPQSPRAIDVYMAGEFYQRVRY